MAEKEIPGVESNYQTHIKHGDFVRKEKKYWICWRLKNHSVNYIKYISEKKALNSLPLLIIEYNWI